MAYARRTPFGIKIQREAWFDQEILLPGNHGIARSQVFVPLIAAATYTQKSNETCRTEEGIALDPDEMGALQSMQGILAAFRAAERLT